jgi:hypothetical protein
MTNFLFYYLWQQNPAAFEHFLWAVVLPACLFILFVGLPLLRLITWGYRSLCSFLRERSEEHIAKSECLRRQRKNKKSGAWASLTPEQKLEEGKRRYAVQEAYRKHNEYFFHS